jgi:hypothetical protein
MTTANPSGGVIVAPQVAGVLNAGAALAVSGGNTATGNTSGNVAVKVQTSSVLGDDGVAVALGGDGLPATATATTAGQPATPGDGTAGGAGLPATAGNGLPGGDGGAAIALNTIDAGSDGLDGDSGSPDAAEGGANGDNASLDIGAAGDDSVDAGADGAPDADTAALSFAAGDILASTAGDAANDSDGTAKVKAGSATANGNVSSTTLVQDVTTSTDGGLVLAPTFAAVVNAGLGVANSGFNTSVGNESANLAVLTQTSTISAVDAVALDDPLIASASGEATNASDGEACACSGDATATGNLAENLVVQDLDLNAGALGLVVVPPTALVLNLGAGIANSGFNDATGNTSANTATTTQTAPIEVDLTTDGLQLANNSGGASNDSNGLAKVGSGNATAIGNDSSTALNQAVSADAQNGPIVASLDALTTNLGLGLANSGVNTGVGNDSVNVATLTQTTDGDGIQSNSGTASNSSDGTALVNPEACEDDVVVPPTVTPPAEEEQPPTADGNGGHAALPRTGGELEVQAALALMLLLAGFGMRRYSTAKD